MICGALEFLNDQAREDALKGEESPTSTLSPIHSEAGEKFHIFREKIDLFLL